MKYILLIMITFSIQSYANRVTHYAKPGTKVVCSYNFKVKNGDWVSYFSRDIEGELQYHFKEKFWTFYVINFNKMLDLLPNLDRNINADIQEVNHINCTKKLAMHQNK